MADTLNLYPLELKAGDVLLNDSFVITTGPRPANFRNWTRVWGHNHDGSRGARDFDATHQSSNLILVFRRTPSE